MTFGFQFPVISCGATYAAKEVLGDVMHNSFSLYKHDEWERYSVYISDWEVEEYLRFF